MIPFNLRIGRGANFVRRQAVRCAAGYASVRCSLLDLLFPPVCALCRSTLTHGGTGVLLCQRCREQLSDETTRFCPRCGVPHPKGAEAGQTCSECRLRHFRFDETISLGRYEGPLRKAIIRMKHSSEHSLAAAVGCLLGMKLQRILGTRRPDVIVPIPKHWLKRIARGTNSAEIIAESVGTQLVVPVAGNALRSRRITRKQSLLSVSERRRNLRGSLQVAAGYNFHSAHVLIVDDTMTTGATANEAARVLRERGASQVIVAVAARAAARR